MQIKNKKSDKPYSVTYREWRTEYLANNKHHHFEILNYDQVVELHVIDKVTGELKFNQVIDKTEADNNIRQFSTTQYIKPLSFEYYDKNLIPLKKANQKNAHFLKRIWNNRPKLKTIYESIINSNISKLTSNIVTGVIIGILILIIWAVYKTKLIELWNNIFG